MFASLRIATLACISLATGLVTAPQLAHAQSLPGGAVVSFEGPYLYDNDDDADDDPKQGNTEQVEDYFNYAHCACSQSSTNPDFREGVFGWRLRLNSYSQSIARPVDIWFGRDCDSDDGTTRNANCTQVDTLADIDTLASRTTQPEFKVFDLMTPIPSATSCPEAVGETLTWVQVDLDGDGSYDYSVNKTLKYDSQPPSRPTKVSASTGESAVLMSWTAPETRAADTEKYQFFCAVAETGQPAHAKAKKSPAYQTAQSLCGDVTSDINFISSTGGAEPLPAWLVGAEKRFICGEASGSATSTRLSDLKVGVAYQVAIVAVDRAGNAIGTFVPESVTPTSVIDFWEDLHDGNGDAEGGFCLAASVYGDDSGLTQELRSFRDDTLARTALGRWLTARYYSVSSALAPAAQYQMVRMVAAVLLAPLAAAALLWHFLTLPGCALLLLLSLAAWRRRRALAAFGAALMHRRQVRLAAAAAALICLSLASRAGRAQSMDPYWDDENLQAASSMAADDEYEVNWHAGIRLGPYTPAIDAQAGGSDPGPYESMFGGYSILPMLDVDYIFLETELAQFGAGGSIGFMSKEAKAYTMESQPGAGRERSNEDTAFRMIPMAATGVFRLTYLDNKYGVPIIPYARGGLAYHVWWVEKPDGGVASVCRENSDTCDANKGRGGSLGLVGSIGLAVRAERIDFESASAMREGGIQHAGFYAELQASKVDDFGTGNKLSVGDITWFAGVDFEF